MISGGEEGAHEARQHCTPSPFTGAQTAALSVGISMRTAFGDKVSAQMRREVEAQMLSLNSFMSAGTSELATSVTEMTQSTALRIVDALPQQGCFDLASGPVLDRLVAVVQADTNVTVAEARKRAIVDVYGGDPKDWKAASFKDCKRILRHMLVRELNALTGLDTGFMGAWAPCHHTTSHCAGRCRGTLSPLTLTAVRRRLHARCARVVLRCPRVGWLAAVIHQHPRARPVHARQRPLRRLSVIARADNKRQP